jgi:hypothetical protein
MSFALGHSPQSDQNEDNSQSLLITCHRHEHAWCYKARQDAECGCTHKPCCELQQQQEMEAYLDSVRCRALLGASVMGRLHWCRDAAPVHGCSAHNTTTRLVAPMKWTNSVTHKALICVCAHPSCSTPSCYCLNVNRDHQTATQCRSRRPTNVADSRCDLNLCTQFHNLSHLLCRSCGIRYAVRQRQRPASP